MKFYFLILLNFYFLFVAAQVQIGEDIDGEVVNDYFGTSVSLSADGRIMAVGAPVNSGDGYDGSGQVRIYEENRGEWIQLGGDINGEGEHDISGSSISLSSDGKRIAIGASTNAEAGWQVGHVRIFEYNGDSWIQIGNDIDGETSGDISGTSVSMSSDGIRVAIGAPNNNDNGLLAGHVRVYEENNGAWVQIGSDIDGEATGDRSGKVVSLSSDGNRVAISALYGDGEEIDVGHVRVFEFISDDWIQIGKDLDGEADSDFFGSSISISSNGTRLAIGGPNHDGIGNKSGHVKIYEENGGVWTQIGDDVDGENAISRIGRSLSLSSDGTRVAITDDFYIGEGNVGRVRIYEDHCGVWTQISKEILGEGSYDRSGDAVALSSDGTRVAISSLINGNENGIHTGHVRIFGDFILPEIVETIDLEKHIKVFPNPSGNLINIKFDNPSNQNIKVQMVDNLGRNTWIGDIIGARSFWTKKVEIEVSGIYFLTVQTEDEILTKKIIITGEN